MYSFVLSNIQMGIRGVVLMDDEIFRAKALLRKITLQEVLQILFFIQPFVLFKPDEE